MTDTDDIIVAVKAAQVTANLFNEPALILFDLSIKRESEVPPGEHYLEKVKPSTCWKVD